MYCPGSPRKRSGSTSGEKASTLSGVVHSFLSKGPPLPTRRTNWPRLARKTGVAAALLMQNDDG